MRPLRAPNGMRWVLRPASGEIRVPTQEPCTIMDGGPTRVGIVWNLSRLGFYLVAVPPLPLVGAVVSASFPLEPEAEPLRCTARVVWLNPPSLIFEGLGTLSLSLPPGCGFAFVALSDSDRARVERRVRAHAPVAGRTS
jgi:hypothetical protein